MYGIMEQECPVEDPKFKKSTLQVLQLKEKKTNVEHYERCSGRSLGRK